MKRNHPIARALMPNFKPVAVVGCLALALAPSTQALTLLPEIVVTATADETPTEPTIDTWVTSQADIQARNAVNVSSALAQVPGLNVQYGASSGEARAWIRGFRDRETLVLYDGIPVSSAYDGTVDIAELSSQGVGSIRVLKSAPSVIYGVNGLSGVIDINPESSRADRTTSLRVQVGTEQSRLLQLSTSGEYGPLRGTLHLSNQRQEGFALPQVFSASYRRNSDFNRRNVLARITHTDARLGDTTLLALRSSNAKGLPPERDIDDPNFERLNQADQSVFGLSHTFSSVPLAVKAFESSYAFRLDEFTSDAYTDIAQTEQAKARTRGFQLFGSYSFQDAGTLTGSASVTQEALVRASGLGAALSKKSEYANVALEYQRRVNDQVRVVAGGILTVFRPDFEGVKATTAFNPQVSLEWDISAIASLRLSAAQRTRFPKLVELFDARYGNPSVNEAKSNNLDLTFAWQPTGALALSGAVYYYNIRDLIEKPTRRSPYSNVPAIDVKGLEVTANYAASESFMLRVAGSLNRAEEQLPDGDKRQLRSRPKTTLLAQSDWRITHRARLTLTATRVNGLYDIDDSGRYRRVKSGWNVNATGHVDLTDRARAYLQVSNATDTFFEQKIGFPRPGRQLTAGLHYAF